MLNDLASAIQVQINSRRETVDYLSGQLVSNIPQSKSQVGHLGVAAMSLQNILDQQFQHIRQVDVDGSVIIKQLKSLNLLQTRLKSCTETLTQMQYWKSRIKETDKIFACRDFNQVFLFCVCIN